MRCIADTAINDCITSEMMATKTIRNLDDRLKARLRILAAEHGRSMEEEARRILGDALNESTCTRIRDRFEAFGGIELELSDRDEEPRAASFPDEGISS